MFECEKSHSSQTISQIGGGNLIGMRETDVCSSLCALLLRQNNNKKRNRKKLARERRANIITIDIQTTIDDI